MNMRCLNIFLCLGLVSCASVETKLPVPDTAILAAESEAQAQKAFARYHNMFTRLDRVSSKILQDNAALCTKTRFDPGISTHAEKSYPKYLRAGAASWLGAGEEFKVFHVRKNSVADEVGVLPGDQLIGGKDKAVSVYDKSLDSEEKLHVRRGGEDLYFAISAPKACDYNVKLKFSGAVNAYATGKSIIVTTAMMEFVQSDEELALVVGHELAHNTMGHIRKGIQNAVLSGFAKRYIRPFEAEADYVGLYYMARAGYEMQGVEAFWRRLGVRSPKSIVSAKTHPVTPSRLLSIREAAAEIAQKQMASENLVPNYIEGKEPKLDP